MKKLLVGVALVSTAVFGGTESVLLPSSVPFSIFEDSIDKPMIGYITSGAQLDIEDPYLGKIGDINYDLNGLIYTIPKNESTFLGKWFESSYTAGVLKGNIDKKHFVDSGFTYDNEYNKRGFFIGFRPSFVNPLMENESFKLKTSLTLHALIYELDGMFRFNNNAGTDYTYDETSVGIAIKPTYVLQGTYLPTEKIGLTVYGGATMTGVLDYVNYKNRVFTNDSDTELDAYASSLAPVYGADITIRRIFGKNDQFSLSSVIGSKSKNREYVIRFTLPF
jgi:hypothetical protein